MARRADLLPAARFDSRSRRHWSWLTAGLAALAGAAVYAGFLGTEPFESENLFVYAALALFVGVAVVAVRWGGQPAAAQRSESTVATAALAGALCAVVADVVGAGAAPATVLALAGSVGAAVSVVRWPAGGDGTD